MTVIIKRNQDRNYDRLFRAIDAAAIFRTDARGERATGRGYEVEFGALPADVLAWVGDRPRDFDVEL
jgi:hypothetical protein